MRLTNCVELRPAEALELLDHGPIRASIEATVRTAGQARVRVIEFVPTMHEAGVLRDGGRLALWVIDGGSLALVHPEVRP